MAIGPQVTPENGPVMGELALPRMKDDATYIAISKDPVLSRPSKSFFATSPKMGSTVGMLEYYS